MIFYLLSSITGILECGWIAFGAVHSLPLWQILCYPLAYHIGNLFPKPFSLSRKYLVIMSILSIIAAGLTLISELTESAVSVLTCISLFLTSAVIQSVRSGLKCDGNRLLKRVFRVGGFALAPLAVFFPSVILLVCGLIALYALKGYECRCQLSRMTGQNGYTAVMMFHQLHYFFYAHITLAAMSLIFVGEHSAVGAMIGAGLFCGTWITYMSVEPIVSKLTDKMLPVFFAGHIGISLLLFAMNYVTDILVFIILWLITGFGGGVVYTISARAKSAGSYNKESMTISENIGHTLGLLTATVIAAAFGVGAPRIMLIFGSVSAMFAAVSMTLVLRKY